MEIFKYGRNLAVTNTIVLTKLHILILLLLSVSVYWNSLDGDFVHDDLPTIVNNKDVTGASPWTSVWINDFWGTNIRERRSHKSYRPLTIITFRLTVWMFGLSPRAFHLTNLALHCLVVVLLYDTAVTRLLLSPATSLLAAALFAVHPVHCEAVSGIVGRADLLAAGLMLIAFRSSGVVTGAGSNPQSQSSSLWKVSGLSLAAMMCKETGIMSLVIVAVWSLSLSLSSSKQIQCRHWQSGAKYCLVTTAMIYLRVSLNGSSPIFSPQDNPASFHKSPTTRFLTYSYLWVFNSVSLLCPTVLSYDWQLGSVPLLTSLGDTRVLHILAAATLLLLLVKLVLRTGDSNIFQTVGFVAAERTLYSPSLGWCVLVARGAERLLSRARSLPLTLSLNLSILSILLFSSARLLTRNTVWASRADLFRSGLASTPTNAKVWYNYGNFLRDQEDKDQARLCYKESVRLWPEYVIALNNLATVTDNQTDIENLLLKALHLDSDCLPEAVNLIHQCQSASQFDEDLIRDLTDNINKRNVNSKNGKYSLEKCTNRSQCL